MQSSPLLTVDAGEVIFDVLLVVGTMGGTWFWIHDPIAKINAEFLMAMCNSSAIYFYHRHRKEMPFDSLRLWVISLVASVVIVVVSVGFDRRWVDFVMLFAGAHQESALRILDTNPPSNLLTIIGLIGAYASLVGLIRLAIKRGRVILYRTLSKRQNG